MCSLLWWMYVCLFFPLSLHREWHLPADINTKAENRAISSSDRCIEHKFFPNSKTELIKSSQPAAAKDRERGLRIWKTKEQHSLLIFIGREAHGERKGGEMKKSGVLTAHGSVLSRTGNAFTEFCLPDESLLAVGWRYASQNEVTIEAFS